MANNIQTDQKVNVVGKLASLNVKMVQQRDGSTAISASGEILVNDRTRTRFRCYVPQKKKDGGIRKDFIALRELVNCVHTIEDSGLTGADRVSLMAEIAPNDYVNKDGKLVQGVQLRGNFLNFARDNMEDCAQVRFEGYIKNIIDDDPGSRVTVYGLNYRGDIIPLRFYVPEEFKDDFSNKYSEGDTAIFNIDIKTLTPKPTENSGGIGVQPTTGTGRTDYVLIGATAPLDASNPKAISEEAIQEGSVRRAAHLKELETEGYRGAKKQTASHDNLDELPF